MMGLLPDFGSGSRLSPGAGGELGSHAVRPRSSHHLQVMTFEGSMAVNGRASTRRHNAADAILPPDIRSPGPP
jgi:hypothetical protein